MKRVVTKIGDVFSVKLDDNRTKYFQLVAFDLSQLNSDVIRAFKTVYPLDEKPNLSEIVNGEVEFYAHCGASIGVKLLLWEKVGHVSEIGDTNKILFRDTDDCGNGKPYFKSTDWYVWHINEDFKYVGKLKGENRKAEIGIVVSPYGIVDRIKTGKYNIAYPIFE